MCNVRIIKSGRRKAAGIPKSRVSMPYASRINDVTSMLIATVRHGALSNIQRRIARDGRFRVEAWYNHQAIQTRRLLQTQVSPADSVPFRKLLKDEAKKRRVSPYQIDTSNTGRVVDNAVLDRWELTVGLEIHAQLNTEHKLFSGESRYYQTPLRY